MKQSLTFATLPLAFSFSLHLGCIAEPAVGEDPTALSSTDATQSPPSYTDVDLAMAQADAAELARILGDVANGRWLASMTPADRVLASAAYAADAELRFGYPTIRQAIAELDAIGVEPEDYLAQLDLAPSAHTDQFLQEAEAFFQDWRLRIRPASRARMRASPR